METKNYSERVREIKNEIAEEIRNILTPIKRHEFDEPFYIHYIEGDLATTEICKAIDITKNDVIGFWVRNENDDHDEFVEDEVIFNYDPNSFFDILDNLKKEIREKKLNTLRELVRDAGGEIDFDGNFEFFGTRDTTVQKTKLMGVEIDDKGEFMFDCIAAEDGECWRDESYPDTDQIDRIIEYVRKKTEKTPEERIALTDEQKDAVAEFVKAFKKLEEMKVGIVMDDDKRLFGVNMTEVDSFQSSYYINDIDNKESYHEVKHGSFPFGEQFFDYYLYSDESLYVKFK